MSKRLIHFSENFSRSGAAASTPQHTKAPAAKATRTDRPCHAGGFAKSPRIENRKNNYVRSMEKVLPLLFLAICFEPVHASLTYYASAHLQVRSAPDKTRTTTRWYRFTSPDGEFTLLFPHKPTREPDESGILTLIRVYAANTDSGMRFSINFQDIGGNPSAAHNNEWGPNDEEIVTQAARQNGQRVVQIHRVAKNILELELWQTVRQTGANINYLRRDVLRRGRVYSLGCGSLVKDKLVDKGICRRFFNSMRFTK